MRKVEVKPYNEQWLSMFKEEANKLYEVFGSDDTQNVLASALTHECADEVRRSSLIIDIHHIGSTSVNGLKAKPIIDIMPVVRDIHQIDAFNMAMTTIGYDPKGENGIVGRRYFQKGGDTHTYHVHIYEWDNPAVERHIAFRDYLCAHPSDAKKYGDLKETLAQRFPYDIESYIKGKEQLTLEIDRKALKWYRSSRESY